MLSVKAKALKPSPTLALAAKAKELTSQGHDVISLSIGEPDWDTPPHINQVGKTAIDVGFTKYTASAGIVELRQAIAEQITQELGVKYKATDVVVSNGAKYAIYLALQALCNPGDEVIITAPYWVSYPEMVELADGKPLFVNGCEQTGYKLTDKILAKAINSKTKIVLLNSPANPTGEVYTKEELASLAAVLAKHPNLYILSDDIYNKLVFNGHKRAPHIFDVAPELAARTILINGVSKSYAMTGWRMGWAVGPQEIIGAMVNIQSHCAGSPCAISQKATLEAVINGAHDIESAVANLQVRRDFTLNLLANVPEIKSNIPAGAFYLWVNIEQLLGRKLAGLPIKDSKVFCASLLEQANVAAVPGIEFGIDGYIRLSYVIKQERMAEAIKRLTNFIKQLV